MLITFVLICAIILLLYHHLKLWHRYWQNCGIPHLNPNFLFGNADDLCLGRKSMLEFQKDIYEKSKASKLLGIYMFFKPTLYITDTEWINYILNRDFKYFYDRGLKFDIENEPLTRHLFHLEGQQWKNMRNKVLPSFTVDGIKILFPTLVQSTIKLREYIDEITNTVDDLDLKDILSRYATDVIGSCAFGINSGALTRGSTTFYKMSKKIFAPRLRTIIKLIFPKLPNFITELFDIKMVETSVSNYFTEILKQQIEMRRQNIVQEKDFIGFMINLQQNKTDTDDIPITDDLIMAQCFMFFIAGYENTSSVLCSVLFELAEHPEIQEKLFYEIKDNHCIIDGICDITYEHITKMTYLDMVVSEVIRIYPPATALIRECAENYNIPKTDIVIEKGLQVVIPVCGLHRDFQYFPFADDFNPENFSRSAKASRTRCAYIPFGDGPRACIGRKFGITQIKVALVMLIGNFKFYPSPKMKVPLSFEKRTFITSIEGGTWVRCERRNW